MVGRDASHDSKIFTSPFGASLSRHIYLTGYRGTGKSTLGAALAQMLNRTHLDLDDRIEATAQRSIREIFAAGGEPLFRDLEATALREIPDDPPAVVSLGGGAILRVDNRRWLADHGVCLWLDASAETIHQRLVGDDTTALRRPSLTGLGSLAEIQQLLAQREVHYRAAGDFRIETDGKTIPQLADEAIDWLSENP